MTGIVTGHIVSALNLRGTSSKSYFKKYQE